MDFDGFVNDIQRGGWNVFGAETYEGGRLTHSYGDTRECVHEIYSAAKSILSVAFGAAWDGGWIDPDRPLMAYLPEPKKTRMISGLRAAWDEITLHRLLTMSVPGLPFRPEGDSWLDFSLSRTVRYPERREFNYSNICAYLVGVALTEALGGDLAAFMEERIFRPLGITKYEYIRCPDGYFYGASGMKMTVHDLSKFGLMLAANGLWEGKRIVSKEYVLRAVSPLQPCREGGYGYFFWHRPDGFTINGKWKQRVFVLPERELVVSCLSHIEDPSAAFENSVEQRLLR